MVMTVEDRRQQKRAWSAASMDRYRAYMDGRLCERCGGAAELLHHRDPSTWKFEPTSPRAEASQLEEWAKCDPLCRPCHVREHRPWEARNGEAE